MKNKPKILITNSVALNGGDEALLRATIFGIKNHHPAADITVLSNKRDLCSEYLPDINFEHDWEFATTLRKKKLTRNQYYLRKLRIKLEKYGVPFYSRISLVLADDEEKKVLNYYKNSDYIISSAGGYIHDIYGYEWRAIAYKIALNFRKKLIFFGQSIGPFFQKSNHKEIKEIFSESKAIVLREKISQKHLDSIDYKSTNVYAGTDIAFSLFDKYQHLFNSEKRQAKRLVMCFRKWLSEENNDKIKKNATELITRLVTDGYSLDFTSTCQGIVEYVDDSLFAREIVSSLPEKIQEKCTIVDKKFKLEELISHYGKYDAYIGMRLHGAILSMLGGTPAFNIAYEDKTKGIFEENGLGENQIWFDSTSEQIIEKVNHFLKNRETIQKSLAEILNNANKKVQESFKIIFQ